MKKERITSPIGQGLKIFAILFLISGICVTVIGLRGIAAYINTNITFFITSALIYISADIFGFLVLYGFGEIIDRLVSIDEKMTKE